MSKVLSWAAHPACQYAYQSDLSWPCQSPFLPKGPKLIFGTDMMMVPFIASVIRDPWSAKTWVISQLRRKSYAYFPFIIQLIQVPKKLYTPSSFKLVLEKNDQPFNNRQITVITAEIVDPNFPKLIRAEWAFFCGIFGHWSIMIRYWSFPCRAS